MTKENKYVTKFYFFDFCMQNKVKKSADDHNDHLLTKVLSKLPLQLSAQKARRCNDQLLLDLARGSIAGRFGIPL